jgi:diketogulonate reductase-like aldo/keto reductase
MGMSIKSTKLSRRELLKASGATLVATTVGTTLGAPRSGQASPTQILTRPIPKTGEQIPAIGMGTWITFNVGDDITLRDARTEVLRTFFDLGGGMVDSSPMYGSAEDVIGYCLNRIPDHKGLFSATKVWTYMQSRGISQMAESRALWGVETFDLMQVHNLLDWKSHLETLIDDKAEGRIRYIGITTSHGRRHGELAEIMETRPIDFVQLTYNIADREVESRLLPLAADRGIAVIVNRPFRRGALSDFTEGKPLPAWASDIDCTSWPQMLLKFIISHPAVTCAIPATSRVEHMQENMGTLHGRFPDAAMRARMIDAFQAL